MNYDAAKAKCEEAGLVDTNLHNCLNSIFNGGDFDEASEDRVAAKIAFWSKPKRPERLSDSMEMLGSGRDW